ncbi:MAG: sigma-70 family RNA polymerase sigma factor [Bacteroidia bacterium]|nr:sigma-70 family RNA polymerase sigma factor [Bacteroidia bacterium]
MTDLLLWQQLKSGNKNALAAIYDAHAPYLLRYGYKITQQEIIIEDAIHDLFVELWKNREGAGNTDNIRAYLTVALRRKIIKTLQKSQKTAVNITPDEYDFDVEVAVDEVIIRTEKNKEYADRLNVALNKLGPRQKEALYLKYYSQMSNEEISEAMGITNQSVRNLIHRSLEQMKKIFMWLLIFFEIFTK